VPLTTTQSVREAVAEYLARGYPVIPVGRNSKAASVVFKDEVFTLDDFTEEHNVGILLGRGWVDVDLDCPEAARAALHLLPDTRRQGRASSPGSHYWYKCEGDELPKYIKYTDLDGEGLLELRVGANLYTVVPPSIHVSGEPIVYEDARDPLRIAPKDLRMATNTVAVATLFGRHWPAGNRHSGAGHLSGFLLRCGFPALTVVQIVQTAATIAGDEEVHDRVRIARDTADKFEKKAHVTGGPSLAQVFDRGEALAAKVYGWLEREGDAQLDKLNRKYCISRYGNKAVVAETRPDGTMAFLNYEDFRDLHYHRKIGKLREGEWYLNHPNAARYDEVVFAPPPQKLPEGFLNAWKGYGVIPDPDPHPELRCQKFLEHMHTVICNGQDAHFAYLLDWCAITVQRPGEPIGVAVVLRGPQGAGKGSFAERFGSLFGPHFVQISSQQQVTGRFNAALARRVVVFADEAIWAGSKSDAGNLKRLVTERTLMIEPKFREATPQKNCTHLIMATNEAWVWPAGFRERRGFILDVERPEGNQTEYFDALHDEWEHGGAEAFLALLLARPVPKRLGPIPVTAALEDQQNRSMDPIEEWWLGVLIEGSLEEGGKWPSFAAGAHLYDAYMSELDAAHGRVYKPGSQRYLTDYLIEKLLPKTAVLSRGKALVNVAPRGRPPVMDRRQVRGIDLPPLSQCREHFDKISGIKRNWPAAEPVQSELAREF